MTSSIIAPSRRGFLGGLITALTMPAIIRTPELVMPISPQPIQPATMADMEALEHFSKEIAPKAISHWDWQLEDRVFLQGRFSNVPLKAIQANPNLVHDLSRIFGDTSSKSLTGFGNSVMREWFDSNWKLRDVEKLEKDRYAFSRSDGYGGLKS